jgi:iron complex outermembrane receptor protein
MSGRKPKKFRRTLSLSLSAALGGALAQFGGLPCPAWAQEPVPKLPATKVEAQPTPGETTQPQAQPPDQPSPNDFPPPTDQTTGPTGTVPVSGGGIFASPAADGYRADSSTTGTIINVPQINFPGVVSVVTAPVIADQQAIRVDDILRDIPTAVKGFDNGFRPDAFLLRGFEVRARDYRWNGYQDFSPAPRDFFNVQRVEILQGPGSVLYGSGQPSGVVNFITKKPLEQFGAAADVQGGMFGFFRTTADVTGAIDEQGHWLVRLNAGYMNTDSFRDFSHEDRTVVAPALTYVWDCNTAITYEFQYLTEHRLFDTGVAAIGGHPTTNPALLAAGVGVVGGSPTNMNSREFLGQPTDFQDFNDYKTAITFVHKFNDDWAMRIGGFIGWHNSPSFATQPVLFGNDPSLAPLAFLGVTFPPTTLIREATSIPNFSEQNYDFIANLGGKFDTFGMKHNLVVGYEFDYFNSTNFVSLLSDPFITFPSPFGPLPIAASSPIDVTMPNYNVPTPPLPGRIDATVTQARNGFYAQDLLEITPHIKVLMGIRGDIVDETFEEDLNLVQGGFSTTLPPTRLPQHDYFMSPRVGLVWQPVEDVVSFYGSYTESFDPAATGIFEPGTALRPETGKCGEGGVKLDLLDKHLSITAAGFSIVKDNVVTQKDFIFSTQIGRQRAQGAEVGMVGRITDQWSIIGNYAYVDSRILDAPLAAEVGQRFRGVPYNNANVWSRYNLIQNCCQSFGVAIGMVYVGNRPGDLYDSFLLPGYTRWDAGVYYTRGLFNASIYLENIFDRQYYVGSLNNLEIAPGNPFTLRALAGIKF